MSHRKRWLSSEAPSQHPQRRRIVVSEDIDPGFAGVIYVTLELPAVYLSLVGSYTCHDISGPQLARQAADHADLVA
ncbi:hypothetical protein EVG20_g165 [Dentipellis fragilis]|uniref:Uncharacterized protein n=1 Tax=Dentipellis fragilis TaxID=205917 RepID=A0A4Y9ZGB0_9AGAM|nr:hypothetical protein EVG20_g165 [Dentipellis fragilis]